MMNSLPRWFGRKKSRDENKKPTIEISEPFAPIHRDGMSSVTHSMASLTSLGSVEDNENLYVNGQVPRGQFREYFLRPAESIAPDHKFVVPRVPRVARVPSTRSVTSGVQRPVVKRSASIRSNVIVTNTFMGDKKFVRLGSGRGSLLKKSLSMDDVLEESLDRSRELDMDPGDREAVNNYYNVAYRDKTSEKLVLSKENLEHHDQLYIEKLSGEGGAAPDPLSTSYLGHTLLSQVEDIRVGEEKAEDSGTDDSKDSGAVSMGGNHYGTPKPSEVASGPGRPVDTVIPGAHPSSEGKRRRNRSNVEAMAAKHNNPGAEESVEAGTGDTGADIGKQENHRDLSTNGVSPDNASGSSGKSISEHNADSGHPDSPDDDGLGPLPPHWEKAYTDKGEPYFIDHNTGTSHWLDPRLSRVQKQRPEDCDEDELPFGWERIDDPHYGTYYIDHVNRRTQYENPVLVAKAANQSADGVSLGTGRVSLPPLPPAPTTIYRQQQPQPQQQQQHPAQNDRPFFTRDPTQLRGEKLQAKLVKSTKGLGFTIVGGDDSEEEFLQIKSVVPNGPAWLDGKLKTGDVLVYVNGTCVLGFTHHDMVTMFQSIGPGEVVGLDVCRGYPLPFDPDDPNTEIVTTVAVTSPEQGEWANELERQRSTSADVDTAMSMPDLWRGQGPPGGDHKRPGSADLLMSDREREAKMENGVLPHNGHNDSSEQFNPNDLVTIPIVKGGMGFGFTIADSAFGQKVKKILDRPRCKNLNEGDILVEINQSNVRNMSHNEVVQVLKDCPRGQEAAITIQRGMLSQSPSKNKFKKKEEGNMRPKSGFLFRSKTPTAELFSTQEKEVVPMRPKTPIVDTRNMSQKSWGDSVEPPVSSSATLSPFSRNDMTRASLGGSIRPSPGGHQAGHDRSADQQLADTMAGVTLTDSGQVRNNRSHSPGRDLDYNYSGYPNSSVPVSSQQNYNNYNSYNQNMGGQPGYNQYTGYNGYNNPVPQGYDPGYGYTGYTNDQGGYQGPGRGGVPQMGYSPNNGNNMTNGYRSGSLPRSRKESTSFEQSEPVPTSVRWPGPRSSADRRWAEEPGQEITVTLLRHESGFGFRIVGGTEEGSQVSIGHIVPGGAADLDGRLFSGDEIMAVDGQSVMGASHHVVVGMMGHAAQRGQVALSVRRQRQPQESYRDGMGQPGPGPSIYPYDVTVSRLENEGFGFVIISSVSRAGSTIGRIIPGSPAERCGRLQVGDRILAVNHVEIASLHHGEIVNLIKDSGYSVTLTVGPPIDDASSTASTSHRSSTSSMVCAVARPTVVPPPASDSTVDSVSSSVQSAHAHLSGPARSAGVGDWTGQTHLQPGKGGPLYDYQLQEDQEVGRHLADEDQFFAVELGRGMKGFGFSIRGGREFHSMPLFVLRMAVDGPATQDGRLQVGDQLIEINGQSTKNMTHGDAIELIKTGGQTVRLLVRRAKTPNPAFLDQAGLSPTTPTPVPMTRPVSSLSQPAPAPGPVSHSSPRYPPYSGALQTMQTMQQPGPQYTAPWGY